MGWVLRAREEARIAELQGRHQTAKRKRFAADLEENVAAQIIRESVVPDVVVFVGGIGVVFK